MSDIKKYTIVYQLTDKSEKSKGGGQGSTFKVRRIIGNNDDVYIVKVLNKQRDIERRARMRREAVSLETLDEIGIPRLIDCNTKFYKELDYNLFIVMEFIPGITLSEFVGEIDLGDPHTMAPVENIFNFYKRLLNIISYCHNNNIVHRDLKPDNIVLRNGNLEDPVIVDFGQSFNEGDIDLKTPDGQIMGNRFFYLPELAKHSSNKLDPRSDFTMASGLLLYLLTGLEPGHLLDENGLLPHQKLMEKIPNGLDKDLVLRLKSFFDKAFQPNINHRFQGVQDIKQSFDKLINMEEKADNLEEKLNEFNLLRNSESKKLLLKLNAKLDQLFEFAWNMGHKILPRFDDTLTIVAGKVIKNISQSIGGSTFMYLDKTNPERRVCFKIVGQVLGNEIIIIGDIVEHTLDDNLILDNGTTIIRINVDDPLTVAIEAISEYIIENIISKIN